MVLPKRSENCRRHDCFSATLSHTTQFQTTNGASFNKNCGTEIIFKTADHTKNSYRLIEEDLRCAVPDGDHFVCVFGDGQGEGSGQTEIGDFQLRILFGGDKQVLRLQVTVDHSVLVAELEAWGMILIGFSSGDWRRTDSLSKLNPLDDRCSSNSTVFRFTVFVKNYSPLSRTTEVEMCYN